MSYITETDKIILKLSFDKLVADAARIKGVIDKHRASQWYKDAKKARSYYDEKHDILLEDFQTFRAKGVQRRNENASNRRIPHPFHSEHVDQKVDYIAGNAPKFISEDTGAKTYVEKLNAEFKTYLATTLHEWLTGTSNSGEDALLIYINQKKEFDYTVCPGEQLIVDKDENGNVKSVLRFYYVDYENSRGGIEDVLRVEVWDDKQVYYFLQQGKDGKFILDATVDMNPKPHFMLKNEISGTNSSEGWGKPPFIFLKNNLKRKSDLNRIKGLIDAYDLINSKTINTVADIQEVIYKLKGYTGTDLSEFLIDIKINKAISLDALEHADADTLATEIPVTAIESLEKVIRKNIYRFGRAVDFSDEALGGDMRTATIEYMFKRLDLKADQLIRQLQLAIVELSYFFAKWNEIKPSGDKTYMKIYDKVELAITKNVFRSIQDCKDSLGIVSEETIFENHPFVKDVQKEIDRKKKEREEYSDINFQNIPVE